MRRLWIIPLVAILVIAVELVSSYRGRYSPPPINPPALSQLSLPTYIPQVLAEAPAKKQGTLLVDTIHFNNFFEGELEPILSAVAERGYDVDFFADRLAVEILPESQRLAALESGLRRADSFVVVSPIITYSQAEVDLVRGFVGKGGKVVILSEASRFNVTNSLATALGINFESDYLYNVREHESNFSNVIFRNFAPDEVTEGLNSVVFYTASSISGSGSPLAIADANTLSSMREGASNLSPFVKTADGLVIALSDFSFVIPPYNAVLDNSRLINNLADFLTKSRRTFGLEDFPFFFKKATVDVVTVSSETLSEAEGVSRLLTTEKRTARLTSLEGVSTDTVFIGLFADAPTVRSYLDSANIRVTAETVETPFAPAQDRRSSGLIHLDSRGGRHVLLVLANTPSQVRSLVRQLTSGEFRAGLIAQNTGLYTLR